MFNVHGSPRQAHRRRRAAVLLAAGTVALPSLLRADVVDTTWIGGSNTWTIASCWSGGVVPNNNATTSFNVYVPAGSTPTTRGMSGGLTLDSLYVAEGGTVDFRFAPASVTVLSPTLQVDGTLFQGSQLMRIGTGQALITGTGTVSTGFGVLEAGSGTLTIDNGVHVLGGAGQIGRADQPLVNRGIVQGRGSAYDSFNNFKMAGTPILSSGTIEAVGQVAFDGTFSRQQLGTLKASSFAGTPGTFQIRGTLANAGQTLQVSAAEPWQFANGTIQGGTLLIDASTSLYTHYVFGGTLDDVWVDGKMYFYGELAPLVIKNGTLNGNAEITLPQASLDGPSRVVSGAGSLVIGSGVTLRGGGGFGGVISGIGAPTDRVPIVNHGTILADYVFDAPGWTHECRVEATSLFNDGTLAATSFMQLNVLGDVTFGSGGALALQPGNGSLTITGGLDLSTTNDLLALSAGPGTTAGTYQLLVLTTGGITGEFDSVTPGFSVEYRNGHTELWATLLPEPTAGLAIAGAAAAMTLTRRRPRVPRQTS